MNAAARLLQCSMSNEDASTLATTNASNAQHAASSASFMASPPAESCEPGARARRASPHPAGFDEADEHGVGPRVHGVSPQQFREGLACEQGFELVAAMPRHVEVGPPGLAPIDDLLLVQP